MLGHVYVFKFMSQRLKISSLAMRRLLDEEAEHRPRNTQRLIFTSRPRNRAPTWAASHSGVAAVCGHRWAETSRLSGSLPFGELHGPLVAVTSTEYLGLGFHFLIMSSIANRWQLVVTVSLRLCLVSLLRAGKSNRITLSFALAPPIDWWRQLQCNFW